MRPRQRVLLSACIARLSESREVPPVEGGGYLSCVWLNKPIAKNRVFRPDIRVNAANILIEGLFSYRIELIQVCARIGERHILVSEIYGHGVQVNRGDMTGWKYGGIASPRRERCPVLAD